eukprot:13685754-Ditylum_brightwellii.AAC.1
MGQLLPGPHPKHSQIYRNCYFRLDCPLILLKHVFPPPPPPPPWNYYMSYTYQLDYFHGVIHIKVQEVGL